MMALQIGLFRSQYESQLADRFADDLRLAGADVHVQPEYSTDVTKDESVDVIMVLLSPEGMATQAIREVMRDALARHERGDIIALYGIVALTIGDAEPVAGWARIPFIDATGAYEDALSAVIGTLKAKLPIVAARRAGAVIGVSARSKSEHERPGGRKPWQSLFREPVAEKSAENITEKSTENGASRVSRRAMVLGVGAAGVVAAVAIGVGGMAWLRRRDVSLRPGERRWYFLTGGLNGSTPVEANGTVYIGSVDKRLYAVDAMTGAQRWSTKMTGVVSTSTLSDGMIYAASADGFVTALDVATGSIHWRFAIGSAGAAPAAANGYVYVLAPGGYLSTLDARTGVELRTFKTTTFNRALSPTLANGMLYVTSAETLFALDAQSGAKRWSVNITDPAPFAPVTDGSNVYVSRATFSLSALDVRTGKVLWEDYQVMSSAPVAAGGVLYFATSDTLQAVNTTTGAPLWNVPVSNALYSPVVAGGAVYVVSALSEVISVSATNGAERWQFSASGAITAPLAVANGLIYAASDDTALYAIIA